MRKDHVLVVVKPGFGHLVADICNIFKNNGYSIVKTKVKRLTDSEAKSLYKIHKEKDFYESLWRYMSSDITTAFILKKKSTDIFKEFDKVKDEIRNTYGESDMSNVIHSSDSYKNFTHEAGIYFYNVGQHDLTEN
jgi:nucleoside-diphosphate kinase